MAVLSSAFFRRPALDVARELLGKLLARRMSNGEIVRARITEVEAYDGEDDLACHASRGRTERNAVMYEPGGVWYVYLCYGMHYMLNIVTGERGYPAAVLIRGVETPSRPPSIRHWDGSADGRTRWRIIVGPGRVTKKFLIDKSLNAQKANRASGLWVEDDGLVVLADSIVCAPRVGVAYAGEWALRPWRFVLNNDILLQSKI